MKKGSTGLKYRVWGRRRSGAGGCSSAAQGRAGLRMFDTPEHSLFSPRTPPVAPPQSKCFLAMLKHCP